MRRELVSAELYAAPAIISGDSKLVHVLCGSHILSHNLKNGKIVGSSESIMSHPSGVFQRGSSFIVSDNRHSKIAKVNLKDERARVDDFAIGSVVAVSDSLTVIKATSSELNEVSLSYVQGSAKPDVDGIMIFKGVVSSVACSKTLIAFVSGTDSRTLTVFDTRSKTTREFQHNKKLTCVAVHPTESQVASGDSTGRIMRWDITDSPDSMYSAVHHWHSVPVSALAYTSTGSVLLSGAEEGVLCIWSEASTSNKPQFIPRLGGSIAHISVSRCNQFAAVSIRNNKVIVIDLFTRSVETTISGTLHEIDEDGSAHLTRVSDDLISISTSSHVQLYNVDSRKSLSKNPLSIQERNHIPSTLRGKVNANPWECQHVSILTSEGTWYMMAALKQAVSGKSQMVKFFSSSDCGVTWSLHTICTGAHNGDIVGLGAVSEGFVSASKDGSVKLWKLFDGKTWTCVKSSGFKNKTPTFLRVNSAVGLVIIGFDRYVTLWHPSTLTELTKTGLLLDAQSVFADLVEDSPLHLFSLSEVGTVTVWDLKKISPVCSTTWSAGFIVAGVCNNRLLVSTEGGFGSISWSESNELVVEKIQMEESNDVVVDSIVPINGGAIVGANKARFIYRLLFDKQDTTEAVFREIEEHMEISEEASTGGETPPAPGRKQGAARILAPKTSSIVSKLFPIENSLDSVGSPEDQFMKLIASLSVSSK